MYELEKQIRKRISYKRFKKLLGVVKEGDPEKTMFAVHDLLNEMRAYGYGHTAEKARNSINLVLDDDAIETAAKNDDLPLLINKDFHCDSSLERVEKLLKGEKA